MIRRFVFFVSLGLLIGAGGVLPAHAQQGLSVQETVLRAKPAAVLIISEVSAEVTLNCGGGSLTVKPAELRGDNARPKPADFGNADQSKRLARRFVLHIQRS